MPQNVSCTFVKSFNKDESLSLYLSVVIDQITQVQLSLVDVFSG